MIYTIRCRRGHCGSQYQYDFGALGLERAATEIEKRAESRGWCRDDAGWLCPFDAPKPAPKTTGEVLGTGDYTGCMQSLCGNVNVCLDEKNLVKDGWRRVGGEWYCPACWKTTQPEPVDPETGRCHSQCDWSIDQVKAAAGEVFLEEMERLIKRSIDVYDSAVNDSVLGIINGVLGDMALQKRTSDAIFGRSTGNEPSEPIQATRPGDVAGLDSSVPPDGGPTRRPEDSELDEGQPF